jgi:hypothetical protein
MQVVDGTRGCFMATELAGAHARLECPPRVGRRSLYDVVFSPLTAGFAIAALALSFLLPVDGLGITVCWFKSLYDLPCPGCGLTRSVTCISHLEFAKAWTYHPFGPLLYALFVANAALLVVPKAKRESLKRFMSRGERWLKPAYLAIVLSFLTFGVVRIVLTCLAV